MERFENLKKPEGGSSCATKPARIRRMVKEARFGRMVRNGFLSSQKVSLFFNGVASDIADDMQQRGIKSACCCHFVRNDDHLFMFVVPHCTVELTIKEGKEI